MKQFIIALGLTLLFTAHAVAEAPILRSLPSDVQKEIERVRQSCPEPTVTKDDEGLITFTVSGAQAVLFDELNFCGAANDCIHGVNCATGFTHSVAIYVRHRDMWSPASPPSEV